MSATKNKPQFVNLQPTAVQVFDETRHPITILPWANRAKNPTGRYVVEGAHFQQFVSGRGPLYPFPVDPNAPPGPLGETEDAFHARLVADHNDKNRIEGIQAASPRGIVRVAGEVVRKGVVVGETQEAFAARLRPLLFAAGIVDANLFVKAPKHELLAIEGVTEANLPRVREMAALIYTEPKPIAEDATSDDETSEDAEDETFSEVDEEEEPEKLRKYTRAELNQMGLARLQGVVRAERFDMSEAGPAKRLRAELIDALDAHKQLVD